MYEDLIYTECTCWCCLPSIARASLILAMSVNVKIRVCNYYILCIIVL